MSRLSEEICGGKCVCSSSRGVGSESEAWVGHMSAMPNKTKKDKVKMRFSPRLPVRSQASYLFVSIS